MLIDPSYPQLQILPNVTLSSIAYPFPTYKCSNFHFYTHHLYSNKFIHQTINLVNLPVNRSKLINSSVYPLKRCQADIGLGYRKNIPIYVTLLIVKRQAHK